MTLDHATIVTLGSKLAPSASTYGRLRAQLEDPTTELGEIIGLIRLDPALTFRIIRLGNSVLFGLRTHNDSLDAAVSRLGVRELHRVAALAAAQQVCQRDLHHFGIPAAELWENAVATAAAAEILAPQAGMDPGLAYTAGLLRNLGRVILEDAATGVYPGPGQFPSVADWERTQFGTTAAAVTADLLQHWRFPADVVEGIRGHLDPLGSATFLERKEQIFVASRRSGIPQRDDGFQPRMRIRLQYPPGRFLVYSAGRTVHP